MKKYICEFLGTAVLVLFGCGTAVVTNGNIVATSLAFGLAIVAMAYSIGPVSGCHVNPAVSLAMLINKKLTFIEFCCYAISQILGAIAGAGLLFIILNATKDGVASLGTNGFLELSGTGISLVGAIITEIVLTFVFVYTILGVTSDDKKSNISGLVIGLTLTFVHLIGINLTGTSVNPARSIGPALFIGGTAFNQLWVFIISPLIGSLIASYVFKYLNAKSK